MSASESRDEVFQKGYALGKTEVKSLNAAVRQLASLVNEHTILWMALCKKLSVTPDELIALLDEHDILNDADTPPPPIEGAN